MTEAVWIIAVCAIIRTVIFLGALLSINKEEKKDNA